MLLFLAMLANPETLTDEELFAAGSKGAANPVHRFLRDGAWMRKHIIDVKLQDDGSFVIWFSGELAEEEEEDVEEEEEDGDEEDRSLHEDDEDEDDRFRSMTAWLAGATAPTSRLYFPDAKRKMPALLCRTRTENGVTHVISSTPQVDRMHDVLTQDWILEHYRENPVVLFSHDPMKVVGHAVTVDVKKDGALHSKIVWDAASVNPLGQLMAHQFAKKILRGISVGFNPTKVSARSSLEKSDPFHGDRGFLFAKNELLEQSAVSIPANRGALAQRSWASFDELDNAVRDAVPSDIRSAILDLIREDEEVRTALEAMLLSRQRRPEPLDHLFS